MIEGVQKLVVEVEDQDRARRFWTEAMGFTLVQDSPYGDERWLEVRTPDRNTIIVLALRLGEPPLGPESCRPRISSSATICRGRTRSWKHEGRVPAGAVEQIFGWWSMFQDNEGNRFALQPREADGQKSR